MGGLMREGGGVADVLMGRLGEGRWSVWLFGCMVVGLAGWLYGCLVAWLVVAGRSRLPSLVIGIV